MKVRDSGMPNRALWETLFDVPLILERLGVAEFENVAELGCGYGTFTAPIARMIRGTLFAFDIDPTMLAHTARRVAGMRVVCSQRDVVEQGFGVSVDTVLLFNILHCERPVELLRHAAEAAPVVLAIHWRHGQTPRGPSLEIRPRPEQITDWAIRAGLTPSNIIDLPPWHYGMRLQSTSTRNA